MTRQRPVNRRDFIKKSVAGSAGLIAAGSGFNDLFPDQGKRSDPPLEINPKINNLRVVYIEQSLLLEEGSATPFESFAVSNTKVNEPLVISVMERMACTLAKTNTPEEAWETIFQRPPNKDWSDVCIAIKPNCAAGNTNGQLIPHASIAIINTICNALIALGAKAENITVYDVNGFSVNPAALYPADLMVSGITFLGPKSRHYPVPLWSTISPALLDTDIIINIASCKGHTELGGTTLTLKNHLGTVGGHVSGRQAVQRILRIHDSEAVLGNPIPGSVPPKQQLAIVDCLWTAQDGPLAAPDKAPCMLVMGTSCPAVDCFTAIKVRLEKLKYQGDRPTFLSYLTEYGYDSNEIEPLLNNPGDTWELGWINAETWCPGTSIKNTNYSSLKNTVVSFSTAGSAFKPLTQNIVLKKGDRIKRASIVNLKGIVIRDLDLNENDKNSITWDTKDQSGATVAAGTYLLRITGSKAIKAVRFTLNK